jgi:hypothetical protein
MAESMTLVSIVWPALDMSHAFQVERQSVTVSTRGYNSDFFNLWKDKGMPKYLHGKCMSWHGKSACIVLIWSSEQLMGVNWHLATFVCSPDALTNMSSTALSKVMSPSMVMMKITRTSTYKDNRWWRTAREWSEVSRPRTPVNQNRPLSASIVRTLLQRRSSTTVHNCH